MKQRKVRWMTFLCTAWVLLCLLVGCTPTHAPSLTYADSSFTVSVRGQICRTSPDGYSGNPALAGESHTEKPISVAATVTVGAPRAPLREGEAAPPRDFSVSFTAPSAWNGLSVSRITDENGQTVTSVSHHGLTFSDVSGTENLWRIARALLPQGDVSTVSPEENGIQTVTITTETVKQTLSFAASSHLPVEVSYTHTDGWIRLSVSPQT